MTRPPAARLDSTGPLSRRWDRVSAALQRGLSEDEATWLVSLSLLAVVLVVVSYVAPIWWPLTPYVIPLVLAMNVLSIGRLLLLDIVIALCLAVSGDRSDWFALTAARTTQIAIVAVTAAIVMWHAFHRVQLGVASTRGESMLVDLRDRLTSQSQLPELPRPWQAEVVLRSAGGASFAGDFIVAARTQRDQLLEVAVVDVSGKGIGAGARALLLSGAFGGLLGSVSQQDFLPAANAYLLRQEWPEGFATAIHLALHLETGDYEVRSAGHPPAVQFHAGSGRWTPHPAEGPVLGLIPDAEFTGYRGSLVAGDALLLFTDGVVETATLDIAHGIDKLLGEAELLVKEGFAGGAERLVRSVDSNSDDRALLMLHRQ